MKNQKNNNYMYRKLDSGIDHHHHEHEHKDEDEHTKTEEEKPKVEKV
jgi:hypothetical protein